jgi:hypothetical protein
MSNKPETLRRVQIFSSNFYSVFERNFRVAMQRRWFLDVKWHGELEEIFVTIQSKNPFI